MKKTCNRCNEEKELNKDNFIWRPNRNIWETKCKECTKQYKKEYYIKNKKLVQSKNAKYVIENKEKISDQKKKWAVKNSDKIKAKSKLHYQDSKEAILVKTKKYAIENRSKINERQKNRYHNDPNFKLRSKVSKSIYKALRGQKNGLSISKFLPYTIEELKVRIESQFETWMNWKNWGVYNSEDWNDDDQTTWTWQIDHIDPQSCLKYTNMEEDNFKECWALENLRPYSAKQNFLDGVQRTRHFETITTLILDIDGTLIKHHGDICQQHLIEPELLPGVKEKFQQWDRKRYNIILVTGRRESVRHDTEKQLSSIGIFYDHLIMNAGSGTRIIVNDRKINSIKDTASAICVKRNEGLRGITI